MSEESVDERATTDRPRLRSAVIWWFLGIVGLVVLAAGVVVVVRLRGPLWGVNSQNLHIAAVHWPEDIVPLIRAGHDVNALQAGETALSQAVVFHKVESVRLLLENGADPNLCGPGVDPPLASPFLHYHDPDSLKIVGLLLDAGADPNVHGTFGRTPLHQAVEVGDLALVRALIAAGADVNAASDLGSPLERAASNGRPVIVEELLQAGADPSADFLGAPDAIRELIERYRKRSDASQP